MTLAEFLLARIAEDEEAAKRAEQGRWKLWGMAVMADPRGTSNLDDAIEVCQTGTPSWCDRVPRTWNADHIARHDPARVLAECDAKRRIVEWHKSWPVLAQQPPTFEPVDNADPDSIAYRASQQMMWLTEQEYRTRFGSEPPTGPILRLLALPYSDHPDYRDEWKP